MPVPVPVSASASASASTSAPVAVPVPAPSAAPVPAPVKEAPRAPKFQLQPRLAALRRPARRSAHSVDLSTAIAFYEAPELVFGKCFLAGTLDRLVAAVAASRPETEAGMAPAAAAAAAAAAAMLVAQTLWRP